MEHPKIALAQQLRKTATPAERILWNHLRGRKMHGLKFRRQQPIGPFIVDFFCAERRMAIELDGASHEDRAHYDSRRQAYLEGQGLLVMRFRNEDLTSDLAGVLETINDHCGTSPLKATVKEAL